MPEKEMIEEVKKLLKEGYSSQKIEENLIKIGYSTEQAKEIMKEATETKPQLVVPEREEKPVEKAVPKEAELALEFEEELESVTTGPRIIQPIALPKEEKPLEKPMPPKKEEAKPARKELTEEEKEARKRAFTTFMVFLFVIIIIAVLAVFIAFPKLGIRIF